MLHIISKTKGFLYCIKHNKLTIREGHMATLRLEDPNRICECFCYKDPDGILIDGERMNWSNCAKTPGEVHNDLLWLEDRDDELAIELFISREFMRIEELKKSIHKYERKIKMIRGLI